jgi:hypothetical protein
MASIDNAEESQKVATYCALPQALKSSGIGSVIFGLIALAIGGVALSDSITNGILALLGAVLLAEGIWFLWKPMPVGFIVDGITIALLGVWNIYVGSLNLGNGDSGSVRWAAYGIFQIYLGIKNINRYREFCDLEKPSDEDLQRMKALLKTIKTGSLKKTPDFIEFRRRSFLAEHIWKARLFGNAGVFVNSKTSEVLIARKAEIDFTPTGKVLMGKTRKFAFRIGALSSEGLIHPDSLERYDAWMQGQVFAPAPIVP